MNPPTAAAVPTTYAEWKAAYGLCGAREAPFTTLSGESVKAFYTEADLPDPAAIGLPGAYPFTRGVDPSMYRGRLWTVGVDDVVVIVGGTIPGHDIPELERLGVAAVFTPGAPLRDTIDFLMRSLGEQTPA